MSEEYSLTPEGDVSEEYSLTPEDDRTDDYSPAPLDRVEETAISRRNIDIIAQA